MCKCDICGKHNINPVFENFYTWYIDNQINNRKGWVCPNCIAMFSEHNEPEESDTEVIAVRNVIKGLRPISKVWDRQDYNSYIINKATV